MREKEKQLADTKNMITVRFPQSKPATGVET
jgi:hypothetical protein